MRYEGDLHHPLYDRFSHVVVDDLNLVEAGSEGEKGMVSVAVQRNGRFRPVGMMFIKDLTLSWYNNKSTESTIEDYLEKYRGLKRLGLPVVPTFRFDDQRNLILMTDVTEGGKFRLLNAHCSSEFTREFKPHNFDEVRKQIFDISYRALDLNGSSGVMLGFDAYSILVDSTGIGRPLLLDIGAYSWLFNAQGYSHKWWHDLSHRYLARIIAREFISTMS
ncbi:hypothetical protein A3F34_01850 [Candidatus Roizmanbacteria bacterium RIFCSPHIGHO2_12_FULL_44_10]|uniref:Aminoglycoside phosphotransferase domain-containing protein n=1 Tax=Candidatus Roizmanbacteria bacterium RIFCSPHIGHO2_12_FULL_44_10 TaxID=1802054 RepID=A0A1F7I7F9_9BACT|nr:MAG: hypothetical protein A3F34_01850 [Candidatus Roizmanbacteria bacterium RIFCSPHIGHO2_12_FULL_44_10]